MGMGRRGFVQWLAAVSTAVISYRGSGQLLPLFGSSTSQGSVSSQAVAPLRRNLLTPQTEVWNWQKWMAQLGPKFTGNPAHAAYVEFVAEKLKAIPELELTRDTVTFPRWDAKHWSIRAIPTSGQSFDVPVSSYYPYSGQTPNDGTTAEIAYAGTLPSLDLSNVKGKIAYVDYTNSPRPWGKMYSVWGISPPEATFPEVEHPVRPPANALEVFRKAGALGVIFGWTNVSDAAVSDQYVFASRPVQEMPALFVGRDNAAKLRNLASERGKVTFTLTADVIRDATTDHLWATLPGASTEEIVLINTHTDGTNATEENGSLALIVLARYFAQIPKNQRRRTLVFLNSSGHLCEGYVGGTAGAIKLHPDIIHKSVAAVTIEHLGGREWVDDASLNYGPTGQYDWGTAITPSQNLANVMLDAIHREKGRWGVVNQLDGGVLGVGSPIHRAGVPIIQYIDQANYLHTAAKDGLIDRLDPDLIQSQIEVFTKVVQQLDIVPREQLLPDRSA